MKDLASQIRAALASKPIPKEGFTIKDLLTLANLTVTRRNKERMHAFVAKEIEAGRMRGGRALRPSWCGSPVSVPVVFPTI
jgi:hypothetical protein